MQLLILSDYITAARSLLQDEVQPYRYDDESLVTTLNMAFYEAFRLRPDLLVDAKYQARSQSRQSLNSFAVAPDFTTANESAAVPVPPAYRMPFVYYMVGQAQLRDVTDAEDTRASAFLSKFIAGLTTLQA